MWLYGRQSVLSAMADSYRVFVKRDSMRSSPLLAGLA